MEGIEAVPGVRGGVLGRTYMGTECPGRRLSTSPLPSPPGPPPPPTPLPMLPPTMEVAARKKLWWACPRLRPADLVGWQHLHPAQSIEQPIAQNVRIQAIFCKEERKAELVFECPTASHPPSDPLPSKMIETLFSMSHCKPPAFLPFAQPTSEVC